MSSLSFKLRIQVKFELSSSVIFIGASQVKSVFRLRVQAVFRVLVRRQVCFSSSIKSSLSCPTFDQVKSSLCYKFFQRLNMPLRIMPSKRHRRTVASIAFQFVGHKYRTIQHVINFIMHCLLTTSPSSFKKQASYTCK